MIRFTVLGEPKPQGSKRAIPNRYTGKVALVESAGAGLKTWRNRMAAAVAEHAPVGGPWACPVAVALTFRLPAPKTVKHRWPIARNRGDIDKLVRSCLDELSGVVIVDDAQVVHLVACKVYGDIPSVEVVVMDEPEILRGGLGFADLLGRTLIVEGIEPWVSKRKDAGRRGAQLVITGA